MYHPSKEFAMEDGANDPVKSIQRKHVDEIKTKTDVPNKSKGMHSQNGKSGMLWMGNQKGENPTGE